MEFNWENFQTAYQKADEATKHSIDSGVIGNCVQVAVDAGLVDSKLQSTIVLRLSHVVLNIITLEQLMAEATKLGTPNSKDVLEKIFSCIKENKQTPPTPQTIPNEISITGVTLKNTPPSIIPTKPGVTTTPHLRTMANDMAKSQAAGERVYTSTQEAILKEGWSTPKPTQNPPQSS